MKITRNLYEKIADTTGTDYEVFANASGFVMLDTYNAMSMLEDLLYKIGIQEEKIEDMKVEIEEYYTLKKFDPYEEYGVEKSDFQ